MVNKAANALIHLLRRRDLLKRDDLELDWRPLYRLYERFVFSPFGPLGLLRYPQSLESNLRLLIRTCRAYFNVATTANEVLEEFRPLMCPFDVTMGKAMAYFDMFLPTFDIPKENCQLWFEELMGFWSACHNSPSWEPHAASIFSRLADHNIGMIDWNPHLPQFFARIQKTFGLPVSYKVIIIECHFLNLIYSEILK